MTGAATPAGDTYYSHYYGRLENPGADKFVCDFDQAMIEGALELLNNPPEQPFCLYLPIRHPHPPYVVEDPWHSMINPAQLPERARASDTLKPAILDGIRDLQGMRGWREDRWTALRQTYYGMCARVDAQLGLLLDKLKETGLYDTTALLFFSDHGDFTGDYGLVEKTQNTFEDCLTRVPFVVKPPAATPVNPRVSDALVELTDLVATVHDLTGIPLEHTQFGRSLVPLLEEEHPHRDAVFSQGGRLEHEPHASEREHLFDSSLYYPRMVAQQRLPEHGKATMVRTKNAQVRPPALRTRRALRPGQRPTGA